MLDKVLGAKELRRFFKTVVMVSVFSICEKFLGFLYRIYLSRTIGAEGIGLYQVALSVFALLLTISCSGTPITVSRLMTKYRAENNEKKVQKVISAGLSFTLFSVTIICLIFLLFRKNFSFLFADQRCLAIFTILLPGLVFTSIYSVLRGVFWGDKDFLPYSIIELLEELCMILVGIILINQASDVFDGAMKAGQAVLISYIFSFSLALFVFFFRKHKLKNPSGQFKPLLSSALPITAMRSANSLTMSLVSIVLPIRLILSGMSESGAMKAFGSAMGQAIPLLFIPTTIIGSFVLVLVPEISENFYKNRHFYLKRDIEKSIKFAYFLTCLFVPAFLVCGEEIGVLIFNSIECGKFLSFSSFMMLFMSLSSISTSSLNSIGLEHKTLLYYIISGIVMLFSIWFLPKYLGIYSLLIGLFAIYSISSILNLRLLNKTCKSKPKYLRFILLSSLLLIPTIILGFMLEKLLLSFLGTFLTLAACSIAMIIFYALLCFGFNLVSSQYVLRKINLILFKKRKS